MNKIIDNHLNKVKDIGEKAKQFNKIYREINDISKQIFLDLREQIKIGMDMLDSVTEEERKEHSRTVACMIRGFYTSVKIRETMIPLIQEIQDNNNEIVAKEAPLAKDMVKAAHIDIDDEFKLKAD